MQLLWVRMNLGRMSMMVYSSFSKAGASPSVGLMSYPEHSLVGKRVFLTPLQRCHLHILQPTGLILEMNSIYLPYILNAFISLSEIKIDIQNKNFFLQITWSKFLINFSALFKNRMYNAKLWCNWRCPWCNGYRRRKWTRRHEFKSWTRLIAFHIALIPLGKVWIQLFSLQLWVNSKTD